MFCADDNGGGGQRKSYVHDETKKTKEIRHFLPSAIIFLSFLHVAPESIWSTIISKSFAHKMNCIAVLFSFFFF